MQKNAGTSSVPGKTTHLGDVPISADRQCDHGSSPGVPKTTVPPSYFVSPSPPSECATQPQTILESAPERHTQKTKRFPMLLRGTRKQILGTPNAAQDTPPTQGGAPFSAHSFYLYTPGPTPVLFYHQGYNYAAPKTTRIVICGRVYADRGSFAIPQFAVEHIRPNILSQI